MEGRDYLLALSQFAKLGPSRLSRLRAFFNSWQKIWEAPALDLIAAGLETTVAIEFAAFRKTYCHDATLKRMERLAINFVTLDDKNYPALLKHIYLPPPLLYYRGSLAIFSRPTVAIVGTRKPTAYGQQATEQLSAAAAEAGLCVVSGLALGIDALVHQTIIDKQKLTAAVLGSGIDMIYPATNRRLGEQLVESGCLLSELPLGTPPFKTNFPRRNRIIAGISLGTLVIEAAEKSGALITARYALAENREVMAVPGNIFSPQSAGTNTLIQDGAKLVTNLADVLGALRLERLALEKTATSAPESSPEEDKVLELLGWEPMHVNELARLTMLDMSAINSRLTIMEIKGLVKNTGNSSYIRLF